MNEENKKTGNKKIMLTCIIAILLIIIMALLADNYYLRSNISDSEKFYMEYNNVPVDNVFKIVSASEAYNLLESEQAIIMFGFKECKWCKSYVPILNDVVTENNVKEVYYCNIKQDRARNSEAYQKLVSKLSEYLYEDDNKNKRIYVPDVYFIKDGKIIGHNNDTSIIDGADTDEYYTEDTISALKEKLTNLTLEVYPKTDDSKQCNDTKGC